MFVVSNVIGVGYNNIRYFICYMPLIFATEYTDMQLSEQTFNVFRLLKPDSSHPNI